MNKIEHIKTVENIDYGLDAPGLMRMFFFLGFGAALAAAATRYFFISVEVFGVLVPILLTIAALYLLGMGSLMVSWSKFIKLRDRETALNLIDWRGDEQVLDVGCGRGLMLIGAAKRLTSGRATGVDIWSTTDQSDNAPEATRENADKAGVARKVEVQTADMRKLLFEANSFDVVMSHWVVHNVDSADERNKALSEMARVLRPGGKLLLIDIEHRAAYLTYLSSTGFTDCKIIFRPVVDKILAAVSFGSFRPSTIIATKA